MEKEHELRLKSLNLVPRHGPISIELNSSYLENQFLAQIIHQNTINIFKAGIQKLLALYSTL